MSLVELEHIEQIKKLKARYLRLMDQRKWEEWGDLFVADATIETILIGDRTILWEGRDKIVSGNREANGLDKSIHHCHTPDIEITSETTAVGSWALFDLYFIKGRRAEAYGYYEDHYVLEGGRWRIKSVKLWLERAPDQHPA